MAVEINAAIESLQLKHQATGKWSNAITPLQIDEGYGVRLIEDQMQQIEAIAEKVESLATVSSVQEIQKALKLIDESLGRLITQLTTQSTNAGTFYEAISLAVSQLTQLATVTEGTNQNIAAQLLALAGAVSALNSAIAGFEEASSTPASTGETEVFETLITISAARQSQPCPLPNTTRSLVFSGRKDSLDRSFDIYWSFGSGNIAQGKYKILWAYNEFHKTGLSFKDKVLYLSCDSPIQIDVCAYYS